VKRGVRTAASPGARPSWPRTARVSHRLPNHNGGRQISVILPYRWATRQVATTREQLQRHGRAPFSPLQQDCSPIIPIFLRRAWQGAAQGRVNLDALGGREQARRSELRAGGWRGGATVPQGRCDGRSSPSAAGGRWRTAAPGGPPSRRGGPCVPKSGRKGPAHDPPPGERRVPKTLG
jgi:hypothetical protein